MQVETRAERNPEVPAVAVAGRARAATSPHRAPRLRRPSLAARSSQPTGPHAHPRALRALADKRARYGAAARRGAALRRAAPRLAESCLLRAACCACAGFRESDLRLACAPVGDWARRERRRTGGRPVGSDRADCAVQRRYPRAAQAAHTAQEHCGSPSGPSDVIVPASVAGSVLRGHGDGAQAAEIALDVVSVVSVVSVASVQAKPCAGSSHRTKRGPRQAPLQCARLGADPAPQTACRVQHERLRVLVSTGRHAGTVADNSACSGPELIAHFEAAHGLWAYPRPPTYPGEWQVSYCERCHTW